MGSLRLAAAFAVAVLSGVLILMPPASGRFVVEKESLAVLSPESIKGRHDASIANFGVPNYGGTLTGVVIYPDEGRTGCDAFEDGPFHSKSKRPVILLVDRGGNRSIDRSCVLCSSILKSSASLPSFSRLLLRSEGVQRAAGRRCSGPRRRHL